MTQDARYFIRASRLGHPSRLYAIDRILGPSSVHVAGTDDFGQLGLQCLLHQAHR
jgi:hypothetical protein